MEEKNNKKRIFIIQNTEIGGHLALSVFLTNLLENYPADVYDLHLICGKIEETGQIQNVLTSFTIHQAHTGLYSMKDNLKFAKYTQSIIWREHKKKKIDILHCFYPNSSLMGVFLFSLFNRKTKILYDVRSPWIEMSYFNNHLSNKQKALKSLIHFSEFILQKIVNSHVFISKGLQKYYEKTYNTSQAYHVIPSGVNVARFDISITEAEKQQIRHIYNIPSDSIIIGSVGSIAKVRRIADFILNNAKEIQNNNVCIVFVGGGDKEEILQIQESISRFHLQGKIIFIDKLPQSEVAKIAQTFDYGLAQIPNIFVYENSCPLKVLEYIAGGIPVLASELKAHSELQKVFSSEMIIYKEIIDFRQLVKKKKININQEISKYDWKELGKNYSVIYD